MANVETAERAPKEPAKAKGVTIKDVSKSNPAPPKEPAKAKGVDGDFDLEAYERENAAARAADVPRTTFHVVGPGRLKFRGSRYEMGDTLELTDDEAEILGDQVATGAPRAHVPTEQRKAGEYRVVGPGSVKFDGKYHTAGALLDLDEKDARSLGEHVERA